MNDSDTMASTMPSGGPNADGPARAPQAEAQPDPRIPQQWSTYAQDPSPEQAGDAGGGLRGVGLEAVRRWRLPLAGALVGAIVAGGWFALSDSYDAQADVVVRAASPISSSSGDVLRQVSMATEAQVAQSDAVASLAAEQLGETDPDALLPNLRVVSPSDTTILQFTYTGSDAEDSAQAANAFAEAYIEYRSTQITDGIARSDALLEEQANGLEDAIEATDRQLAQSTTPAASVAQLQGQRDSLAAELLGIRGQQYELAAIDSVGGQVIGKAVPPASPNGASVPLVLMFGGFLGLAGGFAASWAWGRVRPASQAADEGTATG